MSENLVLVTGASRGIGQAIMKSLAMAEDSYVVGTATSAAGVEKINAFCQQNNLSASGALLDISDFESTNQLLAFIQKSFGKMPNVLINNAGVTADNLAIRMSVEEWQKVINTNLNGVFYLTQKLIRHILKAKDAGRIVNIGSIVGSTGNPGQANYAAAKAALVAFSKSLAAEVAVRGVTVNTVSPGFIKTDMTDVLSKEQQLNVMSKIPMKRMGLPEDIAEMVKFIVSKRAVYITGCNFHVNGGMFMG